MCYLITRLCNDDKLSSSGLDAIELTLWYMRQTKHVALHYDLNTQCWRIPMSMSDYYLFTLRVPVVMFYNQYSESARLIAV